ncbi:hypothetical protein JX265_010878 [Neoarthrinium moseri]|uniref:Uncharacterized protein n=1 Tax=Neoarthrinium moseri TaxID=1658444 RepID=A0A9Q0AL65_9PEZI|nr:uncharacterized protein JN550_009011 [Neoarthrinium moseri]KAI1846291.1 hypothetical protein JX266_007496 [Neoarthrinium moseri]KAI1858210.1 hypothetical protein JX265_010878 [Neoarthrinium moseri]KAI1864454.1 hypothetical protein JN550_009011 [Neoarthrinium moseri]
MFKIIAPILALLGAIVYQLELPRMVRIFIGVGHTAEPLSSFPYTCRRIYHKGMEACEDMWLSQSTRQLFLACSDPLARAQWMPNMLHFNVSGRGLNDAIVVVDIDEMSPDKLKPRVLETPGFPGTNGDGRLHLVGLTGVDDSDGNVRLWVINAKPSVDPMSGEFSDNSKVGGNSTVELFRAGPYASSLDHVKTFAHSQIATPNNVAPVGDQGNSFYFTNDHGVTKTGIMGHLAPVLGGGDVSFCDDTTCKEVARGLKFPNGLAKGHDGLIYVPSSILGVIDVFEPQSNGNLTKVDQIDVGYSLDNLAVDSDGEIFAAVITDTFKFFAANNDPYGKDAPTAAVRIHKGLDGRYKVAKVIEDSLAEVLPASTAVVHDPKTGKLFFSGVSSPFVGVCEPK